MIRFEGIQKAQNESFYGAFFHALINGKFEDIMKLPNIRLIKKFAAEKINEILKETEQEALEGQRAEEARQKADEESLKIGYGDVHRDRISVPQNIALFQKSAEQGLANAQNNLGYAYYNGNGVAQNYPKAIELFQKAVEQGHDAAQANLAAAYYTGNGVAQNYAKSIELCQKSAEQGLANAQNNLGYAYYNGLGVTQNDAKAFEWYQKAAEQGDVTAQYNLGDAYEKGKGVTQNDAKAFEWYQKAAEQGLDVAQEAVRRLK